MKWDDKYPNAVYLDEPQSCIVKGRIPEPCWHCGALTVWYEINYGAFLCSEECRQAVDDEYIAACRRDSQ